MNRLRFKSLIPLFFSLSLLSAPLHGGALRVAVGNNYPPFTDETLLNKGLATEIVETALKKAKLDYSIAWVPWTRCEEGTANLAYDVTFPYINTPDRSQRFDFSDPILTLEEKLVVRKGEKFDVTKPQSLKGLTFCRAVGYGIDQHVQALLDQAPMKLARPADFDNCLRMLDLRRVDMTNESQWVARYMQKKVFGTGEKFDLLPFGESFSLRLMIAKSNPRRAEVLDAFNKALGDLHVSKDLDRMIEKHLK